MKKNIIILLSIFLLSSCVGSSTSGVFGSGVSIALDPRTLGTQIDDSIMQKTYKQDWFLRKKDICFDYPSKFLMEEYL